MRWGGGWGEVGRGWGEVGGSPKSETPRCKYQSSYRQPTEIQTGCTPLVSRKAPPLHRSGTRKRPIRHSGACPGRGRGRQLGKPPADFRQEAGKKKRLCSYHGGFIVWEALFGWFQKEHRKEQLQTAIYSLFFCFFLCFFFGVFFFWGGGPP